MNEENKAKPSFLRRTIAYLIDMILVALLSTIISMIFINNESYQKRTEQLMDLTKSYSAGEMTKEEYSKEFDELNYYLTKDGIGTTIVSVGVSLVYYVILCYFCHGITLGKFITKLRIVSAKEEKELNMFNYLIRGLFVNLILSNLISIIFVETMNKSTFVSIYPKVSNALTVFLLATIIFVMYRNDGRGLHDLLANTKIISLKEEKVSIEKEEVVEAKVIEEKKTTNKKKTTGGKK